MQKLKVDYDKCMACGACIEACQKAHKHSGFMRYRYIVGDIHSKDGLHKFISCLHCEEASCLDVCAQKVFYRDELGRILRHQEKCIACYKCLDSCSIKALQVDFTTGKVGKCDLCASVERDIFSCVLACPTGALYAKEENR